MRGRGGRSDRYIDRPLKANSRVFYGFKVCQFTTIEKDSSYDGSLFGANCGPNHVPFRQLRSFQLSFN